MYTFDRLDMYCIVKTQQALNFLGKKFGFTKDLLLVNLFYVYMFAIIVDAYVYLIRYGFSVLYALIWTTNFLLCAYFGPRLIKISCRDSNGPFRAYMYLRPFRWLLVHVTFPMNIGLTIGTILGYLFGHDKPDIFDFVTAWFEISLQLAWAYVICCIPPPPKERKDTVTKLAYQNI